jgi:hypothetical protein
MSYFKYAERSSESRVDWNEISKGMVDMLKEQTRLRNEKLDEAVKLQGEVTTTLSEAPMGSDVNANQRVSEFAADAQEYSLMMNKLWRSGEMSYREYMAATNNFKTNTEGYLSQAEKYAANYEKHVKRMEEQIASGVEVSELARVEDFGNFSKFTPVIDAPTGSIGLVGEDGTKYASVTQLGVAVMSQYDRLDVEGRTTDVAKQMGTTVEVLKAGDVRTLESALQNADYVDAEDDAVSGILIGDNAHTSVLVDFKRGLYSTTHDINDAINDPNAILMVPSSRNSDRMIGAVEDDAAFERYIDEQATRDGQPLTDGEKATLRRHRDAQREQSFETVREQLRARLDWEETPTADTDSRDTAGERGLAAQGKVNLRALEKIHGGEDKDVQEGLEHVFGKDPSYRTSRIEGSGDNRKVIVEYYDKAEKRSYTREFNIPVGLKDWIDVGAAEFYNESQIPYVYDAYENQPRLYEGRRGDGVGQTRRMIVVDDLASIEVTDDAGAKVSVGDRIKGLVGENAMEVFDGKGVNASANADVIRSALNTSAVGLEADVTSINEDVIEKATGKTIRRSGIRIFVPGRMDVPLVVPNSTESLASLLGILEVIASSPSVKAADLVAMLPDEAAIYNDPKVVGTPSQQTGGGAPRPSAPRPGG